MGLIETIKVEKKRRQRGKKLGLTGEEDTGALLYILLGYILLLLLKQKKRLKLLQIRLEKKQKRHRLRKQAKKGGRGSREGYITSGREEYEGESSGQ